MRVLSREQRIYHLLERRDWGAAVVVSGWVRTRRDSKGGFSFLEINDGSCLKGVQVVADATLPNYHSEVLRLVAGCSVRVEGELRQSPGRQQPVEVLARHLDVLGWVEQPETYPLQKKRHSLEFLREVAHLRPRANTFGAVARLRNALAFATHEFFQQRGFLYLHTPIITANDCEGAGEMFRVTTLDPLEPPRLARGDESLRKRENPGDGKDLRNGQAGAGERHATSRSDGGVDYSQDFFGRKTSLTVSGQLSAETYACALTNVYTFGPTFRAENSNTARHLAEFWMIEPEMAFCDLEGDMDLAEEYLKHLIRAALERCADDMAFFQERFDPTLISTLEHVVSSPFERITYGEAIDLLKSSGEAFEFPVEWGKDLQSEHERYLTEKRIRRPVIVRDYPAAIKAFYMRLNDSADAHRGSDVPVAFENFNAHRGSDVPVASPVKTDAAQTVAAMDVLVPKVGEIIGGSQREERRDVLERRMAQCGLNPKDYWWYLDLRRYGTVPHSGFGLGFERGIQFISGLANIRDVIPFPRTPKSAEF